MIAVVVVRDAVLPAGAEETVAEARGRALLVGPGAGAAAGALTVGDEVVSVEAGSYVPGAYAVGVTAVLRRAVAPGTASGAAIPAPIVMPASADGRDLAPRVAALLGWPLLAGCVRVGVDGGSVVRTTGRVVEEIEVDGPFVATLLPGVRGVGVDERRAATGSTTADGRLPRPDPCGPEADVVEITPPDPASIDLAEAARIVAGGQGLGSAARFELLGRIGAALGASLGGTRVASDAGWIPFERQIGTTGVAVDPRLYLAFAISGAVQHTSGLGQPDHVISVNTDGSCPMMNMADLAIVSDATAVLDELAARLGL